MLKKTNGSPEGLAPLAGFWAEPQFWRNYKTSALHLEKIKYGLCCEEYGYDANDFSVGEGIFLWDIFESIEWAVS